MADRDDDTPRGRGGFRSPVPGGFGWTEGEYGHEPWNRGEGPGWMQRPGDRPYGEDPAPGQPLPDVVIVEERGPEPDESDEG